MSRAFFKTLTSAWRSDHGRDSFWQRKRVLDDEGEFAGNSHPRGYFSWTVSFLWKARTEAPEEVNEADPALPGEFFDARRRVSGHEETR